VLVELGADDRAQEEQIERGRVVGHVEVVWSSPCPRWRGPEWLGLAGARVGGAMGARGRVCVRVRRKRTGMRRGEGLGPICSGRVGRLGQKKGFGLPNCLRPAQLVLICSFYLLW
jgi:hypothetical protein